MFPPPKPKPTENLTDLARSAAEHSSEADGDIFETGPLVMLRRLQAKTNEAIDKPDSLDTYAEMLLLFLDATRRAGFSPKRLVYAASLRLIRAVRLPQDRQSDILDRAERLAGKRAS